MNQTWTICRWMESGKPQIQLKSLELSAVELWWEFKEKTDKLRISEDCYEWITRKNTEIRHMLPKYIKFRNIFFIKTFLFLSFCCSKDLQNDLSGTIALDKNDIKNHPFGMSWRLNYLKVPRISEKNNLQPIKNRKLSKKKKKIPTTCHK